ncbi:MAG: DnaJ domain-containing protein [Thermovirgaceae bacterium]|nr:DnaJ domain-containing protein [Thermovirgaceae bacterium]
MLIFVRLFRFLLPLVLGFLLIRTFSGLFYGWLGQGRRHGGGSYSGNGPGYAPPPPPGRNSFRDPYVVLGCSPRDPDEKIRKTYRKLVARYHPDKFIGLQLDKEFIDLAARRFQEIQEAYEEIRRSRGFV